VGGTASAATLCASISSNSIAICTTTTSYLCCATIVQLTRGIQYTKHVDGERDVPRSSPEGCNRPSMSMAGSVSPGFWKTQSLWNAKVTRVARGGFGAKAPRLAARPMLIYFAILIYCASRSPRPRCLARLGLDRHGVAVREWHSKT